jgi:O-antigen/teichoic acid export membrane protein
MRFGTLLLIGIVLAKSHLSVSEIGSYEIFLFITALLTAFWINGFIQSFLPLYKNNSTFSGDQQKSPEIFNAFVLLSGFAAVVVVLLVVFQKNISTIFTSSSELHYLPGILLYIFLSSPAFLVEYIYLLRNQANKIIRYGISIFSLQFIFVSTPIFLEMELKFAIAGLVISALLRYVWLWLLLLKYADFTVSFKFIKEHLHFGYPLVVSTLLGSSAQYVDGLLVVNSYNEATFAIFKYGARELPLVVLMANALSTAMIADFSSKQNLSESLSRLKKKTAGLMHLLFPLTLVLMLSSQWLYPRVFNENFSDSAGIFNIYLLLIISRLLFPHSILIGLKRTRIIMYASAAELVVNIGLSILFIGYWGIEGVAYATLIAYALQKAIWIVYNKRQLQINASSYIPLGLFAGYSVLVVVVYMLVKTV